ncbi:hypothetical protein EVAR_72930_1 [Eumeta japonica]|uniref:Uncharacterized protein n=1 Tax=Eumeta variegata TaxID=151549 RepID=A0A4C1TKA7_EUMVA|nr:hypothetical protein EVAR_72930_1 [Eumeta japonica]
MAISVNIQHAKRATHDVFGANGPCRVFCESLNAVIGGHETARTAQATNYITDPARPPALLNDLYKPCSPALWRHLLLVRVYCWRFENGEIRVILNNRKKTLYYA